MEIDHSNGDSFGYSLSTWDVAELTWENSTLGCIVHQCTPVPDKAALDFPKRLPGFTDALGPCSAPQTPRPACVGSDGLTGLDLDPGHRLGSKGHEIVRSKSSAGSAVVGKTDSYITNYTSETSEHTGELNKTSLSLPRCTNMVQDDQDSIRQNWTKREEENENQSKVQRRSTISTRSRATAVHNQTERKRRERINKMMKDLQKLMPNSSKTDKASILDEAIEYLRQLQATVQLMSQTTMQHTMMPMSTHQLPACMLDQMGMTPKPCGVQPAAGFPRMFAPFNPSTNLVGATCFCNIPKETIAGASSPNPPCTLFATQTQTRNVDIYKMPKFYHQLYQPLASNGSRE